MSIEPNISKTFMDTELPLFPISPTRFVLWRTRPLMKQPLLVAKRSGWLKHEMPGLMALREEFAGQKPLAGAKIMGSLHMTIQTVVLIETLTELGS